MPEFPKQRWRLELGWGAKDQSVFLNDEQWLGVSAVKVELQAGGVPRLTLELIPNHVQVLTDPELHLVIGSQRFRVVEETPADQPAPVDLFDVRPRL